MSHKLLDSVTGDGVSSPLFLASPIDTHTVQVSWTGAGSISAMTIDLEGSLNNRGADTIQWLTLGSYALTATDLTNKNAMFHVDGKLVNSVRANIASITKVDPVAITVLYQPMKQDTAT